ncbi:multidrug resistance-associated protein 1 [Plasmodium sp. DRC-Itaito]|nr:multidrug resistance-associated protein 1 [Plasmodium sp. DRC-Itaito]
MTTYKENVGISNKGYKKKQSCRNMSFLNFATFDWVRPLINDLLKGNVQELPNICGNFNIPYYASKLEENLRDIQVKNYEIYNEKKSSDEHVLHHCNSNDASEKKVYNVYYNNILWSILKTFKFRIILIISFYILETLLVTLGGKFIDYYMRILEGQKIPFYLSFLKDFKVFSGLVVVMVMFFHLFFEALLYFYFHLFTINLEVSLMYFLYKINLYSNNNHLKNPDELYNRYRKFSSHTEIDEISRDFFSKNVSSYSSGIKNNNKIMDNNNNNFMENDYIINFIKNRNKMENDSLNENRNSPNVNIYNIMFSDVPSVTFFVTSCINLFNVFIKIFMSFYVFHIKIGSNSVGISIWMSIALYSTMILFEFLPSLYKSKYLIYRDKRIDNMHHVLKEFKLIKMFNWESFAFKYINIFRIKEMKYCKIRLYLSNIGVFISAVSSDIIEVVIFFMYLKDRLNKKEEIKFTSIIMPLYVYKILISNVVNFPNLVNNVMEGSVNIKRLNNYINDHLFYNDIKNYFMYSTRYNKDYNIVVDSTFLKNENITSHDDSTSSYNLKHLKKGIKNKLTNMFKYFFFYHKLNYHKNIINKQILSGSFNNIDDNTDKKMCFQEHKSNSTYNYNANYIHEKKEEYENIHNSSNSTMSNEFEAKRNNNEFIIKLENCSFGLSYDNKCDNDNILKNINFNLKRNSLAIIIGNVGSGKSAFFHSILGDLSMTHGNMHIENFFKKMPILYVPQNSWLYMGNIRSMILFGNEYNPLIYKYTILQSELLNDLSTIENGDMKYINDDHSLSKGQKVRICLARALYEHYIHMYKLCKNYEKRFIQLNEILDKDLINNKNFFSYNNKKSKLVNYNIPFNENYLHKCLMDDNNLYLYLLDDVFTSLDPSISKKIFYNLFCKEDNISFKDNCSFIISMNKSTLDNFLIEDILDNVQYEVEIFEIQDKTLKYRGNISEYMEKNNLNITKESHWCYSNLNTIDYTRIKLFDEVELNHVKHSNKMLYKEAYLVKGNTESVSFEIDSINKEYIKKKRKKNYKKENMNNNNKDNIHMNHNHKNYNDINLGHNFTDDSATVSSLGNEYTVDTNTSNNSDKEENVKPVYNKDIHEKFNKSSSLPFVKSSSNMINNPNNIKYEDNSSCFKGSISLETYLWYFQQVGFVLLTFVVIFMLISIFTDEIKFVFLTMMSIISKNNKEQSNIILQKQARYLEYFVILPIISLITSGICFAMIIYGNITSAIKVHNNILCSILNAPLYIFYNNNLGNIINRFIIDISAFDYGFLKRIYKAFFIFFRCILSSLLIIYMLRDCVFIFPFVIILIYFFVFKRFSRGCKESQRLFLACHTPLCNIYSNALSGKNIINIYKKNTYLLDIYEHHIINFRINYFIKWLINIWASLYIKIFILLLTTYIIMHPHLYSSGIIKLYEEKNYDRILSTLGYCISFSARLGVIIKFLLCDYTHIEKEMCCVQRLEEFAKISNQENASMNMNKENELNVITTQTYKEKNESTSDKIFSIIENKNISLSSIINRSQDDESEKKYGIKFENVYISYKKKIPLVNGTYKYIDEEPSLKNINMYALKNEKIGIVGKSGAGKSTILLSILGLINISQGKITIEGRDIRTYNRKGEDSIVGILPQSSFVFYNWNIRTFIDPYNNFTDDEIVHALKLNGINLGKNDLYKYMHKQDMKLNYKKYKNIIQTSKVINQSNDNTILLTNDCIRYLSLVRLYLNRHKYKIILIDEIPIFNLNNSANDELNSFLIGKAKSFNYIIRNHFANNTVLIISHHANTLSCCDYIYLLRKREITYRCSYEDVKTQSELSHLLEMDD